MDRLIIRGGTIVSMDADVGELVGDVLVEDGRIAAIGPVLEAAGAEVLEAGGGLVFPGFVDTHRHTWSTALRLLTADWTLLQYYAGVMGTLAPLYEPEDVYAGTLLGALEALDGGVTTLLDWAHVMVTPAHADASLAALRDAGLRAVFGWGEPFAAWRDPSAPEDLGDLRRLRDAVPSDDGLVTLALAARGPDVAPLDATERAWRLARELGLRISPHVGAGPGGTRPIARLAERGLLGPDTLYVHGNALDDDELALIAESGGSLSVSPDVELHMGHGLPATGRFLAAGLRPSLSVDACTNVGGDMFGAMRSALGVARAAAHQGDLAGGSLPARQPLLARDVLGFATIEGARALGLDGRTGSLTPGKDADLVVLRPAELNLTPLNHAPAAIALAAHPGNVAAVVVRGRVLKRDGVLIGDVAARARRLAVESRDRVLARAGVEPGGHWLPVAVGADA